ncbi:Tyrosine-protein phosphatase 99A [Eumeta japonica]|uniref:Tyrosine-protein phosphatase 99A n=1 Tax=Eumeta variegata TaxID=151549 RepID=A0A4C1SF26_EUMVA|nr:Tyrosine-protein phosphatase 99A [Eumeta japonica]
MIQLTTRERTVAIGAIFGVFILCVDCDNADKYNEKKEEIYVPSAPQNLTANRVTSDEIHLSWAPPSKYFSRAFPHSLSNIDSERQQEIDNKSNPEMDKSSNQNQADEPSLKSSKENVQVMDDSPLTMARLRKDILDFNKYESSLEWYKNDRRYTDGYSLSNIMNDDTQVYRGRRELRYAHRHRKRRQGNTTNDSGEREISARIPSDEMDGVEETHYAYEMPIKVEKKSLPPSVQPKDSSQVAYVLYYQIGVPRTKSNTIRGIPTSEDIKNDNIFSSSESKNLTLLNTAGILTKIVGFRLKYLKHLTPYKIWVRAFYNFSLEGVSSSDLLERLGPPSEALYVLTDVRPPSPPIILNLTCDQRQGILYLQWRQPMTYDNSLDLYVVTLRKLPEIQPWTRLTLPTFSNDIETAISVNLELRNDSQYEVKIYAVTGSVTRPNTSINGTESTSQVISSEWCAAHSEAMSPGARSPSNAATSMVALVIIMSLLLVTIIAAVFYWRCRTRLSKCISAAYSYLEEGGERAARAPLNAYKKPVVNCSPLRARPATETDCPVGSAPLKPPRMATVQHPAVPATGFPAHVAALHADGDIGFSKEYEVVVSRSAALAHTSHHSHRPENRMKNRYLNITAYDHSRVCVSSGARCGAQGCVGAGRGVTCDYVNANFIDGILPTLDEDRVKYIRRKLAATARQPPAKPAKPPPNLAEGIESAFLNIEFSGIVESEEQAQDASDSDRSDDEDDTLDDVYVNLDGESTRVKLEWLIWKRRYIATQGPTPATLDAFWRMIWQHRVHTLVMITNLVERGRRKCDMYWPSGGRGSTAEFGGVRVMLLHEDVRATYTVRRLRVTRLNGSNPPTPNTESSPERTILQYHYTVWPDHGTPRHPLAVLPFVRAASADPGTVLVHCSAGVGRTGTYIVLDAQLNQLKLTGTLSPLGFLCRARTQRNHLVQTEEQYVFVHDALLEHVRSGNTEVDFSKAKEYLWKLLEPITREELEVLESGNYKNKSVPNLTNGDVCSVKSVKDESYSAVSGEPKTMDGVNEMPNGENDGSQTSLKTDELNSEPSKSVSVVDVNGETLSQSEKEMVNGNDETEGIYDLAPRSTDTYSKKMQAYNNLSLQEKEEVKRANRAENYALLERMRMLAGRSMSQSGPPPVNLLEKQFQLITRSCVETGICARATHNAEKNRPGGLVPSDGARVLLVPKPGVEGSDYVNASWVCGRRRLREYCVAQHPPASAVPDIWRLLWDHTAQLVLVLTDDDDPDCETFWPTEDETELFVANFRASFVSKDTYVAYRKSEKKVSPASTPSPQKLPETPESTNLKRQESTECADDERLIPETNSPDSGNRKDVKDPEPVYRFDRTELMLEKLNSVTRDLSARKSIANGDLFPSLVESRRTGPKSPKSPSKMSLKNFKISSPTRFKFPDWSKNAAGSPPDTAPPPPPVPPAMTVEEEIESRRPCYYYEKVQSIQQDIPCDRIIEVTNVSVHSLQDDYQLSVKFLRCKGWLDGDTTKYVQGKPEENEHIRDVREANNESEREEALNRLTEPYKDSFGLIEFVAGSQMEYKNGPVVVVDK